MAVLPPDPIFIYKQCMGYVHCLNIPASIENEPPSLLLAGSENGNLYIWNFNTNRLLGKFYVGPSILSIHHIENKLITQEKEGAIKIWHRENSSNYKEITKLNTGVGFCRCCVISNKYILVAQENSIVEMFDLDNLNPISKFQLDTCDSSDNDCNLGHVMCIKHVNYSGNDYILVGYESGDLITWNIKAPLKLLNRLKLREYITSIDFDLLTKRGVCCNSSKFLQIFQMSNSFVEISLKCELPMTNKGANIVRTRADGKILVAGGWDGKVYIYSWRSLRLLAVLDEHKGTISDIIFSERPITNWNTNVMAVTGQDGVISLWNLYNNPN